MLVVARGSSKDIRLTHAIVVAESILALPVYWSTCVRKNGNRFPPPMPPVKTYKEACPSHRCTRAVPQIKFVSDPDSLRIPADLASQRSAGETFGHCFYCGVVWIQKDKKQLGLDARIIGKYDRGGEGEFKPFTEPTLEQNTSRYWEEYDRKRRQQRQRSPNPPFGRSR